MCPSIALLTSTSRPRSLPSHCASSHEASTTARGWRWSNRLKRLVADLSDRSQCKAIFGLNHSFLKKVMPDAALHVQGMDENGYSRYWRDPLDIDDARFLVCSQWFAWQRPAFDRWVGDLEASETADGDRRPEPVNSATAGTGLRSRFRFTR